MALDQIYQTLEGQITGALAGRYAAVQGLVEGPLQTAMAINLVIVGFAIMRGVTNEPFGNYLSTWLKAYLVIIAATSSLAPAIASAAQSLPDQLATALGGNMAASFDTFVANAINPAQAIHGSSRDASCFLDIAIVRLKFRADKFTNLILPYRQIVRELKVHGSPKFE